MNKHTEGKWESIGAAICVGALDIARVYQPNGMDTSEFYANARLIAAAPDLLIELRQAVIQMEMAAECIENKRYDEALLHVSSLMRSKRAAITKATGE